MTKKDKEKADAIATLKEWGLVDGKKVYTDVTKVARSGMSRNIRVQFIVDDELRDCSYWVAKALGWPYKDGYDGGVRVGGCGMDMRLHLLDTLSRVMGYGSCNQTPRDEDSTGLKFMR